MSPELDDGGKGIEEAPPWRLRQRPQKGTESPGRPGALAGRPEDSPGALLLRVRLGRSPRECVPAYTLSSDFWPPKLCEKKSLYFLSHPVHGHWPQQLKLMHLPNKSE